MSDIIMDFDGTIADSFELIISIFHDLTNRHKPLTKEEIERLRGRGPLQIIEDLRIKPWLIPWLVARGRRQMRGRMQEVRMCDGMDKLIRELRADGHRLYISSSNSVQNIDMFLTRHRLRGEFTAVYGGAGLLGKGRMLRKVVRRNHLEAARTFYVGDEVRDIEAAERAGLRMISVSWGSNTPQILLEHEPDFLVHKPAQIAVIVAES